MAKFLKIERKDALNTGRKKLNNAIDGSEESVARSIDADNKATQALANSESTQTQLDTIVIEGDSSVEAAQARVDAEDYAFPTLKERLDTKDNEFTSKLEEKASQEEVQIALLDKANKEETELRFGENEQEINNNQLKVLSTEARAPIQFIAHRGFSSKAPENTLPAFFMAGEAGFHGIESDIHVTSDGHFIVIHDATVDRTTSGTGNVADMTFTQLRALDAGSWFNNRFTGHKLPTLDEYLQICKEASCIPYLEIKSTLTDTQMDFLIDKIVSSDMEYSIVVISFLSENLTILRSKNTNIKIGLLTSTFSSGNVNFVKNLGNAFVNAKSTAIDESSMAVAKANKIDVAAYTVDRSSEVDRLIDLGVKIITTNNIPRFKGGR